MINTQTPIRICKVCGTEQPIENFSINKGYALRTCKKCIYKYRAEWGNKNKDKIKAISSDWQKRHKDKVNAYNSKYKKDNPEWFESFKKKYKNNNGHRIAACRKKTYTKLYNGDTSYRISAILRSRLRMAIYSGDKKESALKLLGCSLEYFKTHISSMFEDGMSWDNYGYYEWHIDHIRPCASFDLSDLQEQKKCFHYTNLQPLWRLDNLRKHAKYDGICTLKQ